MLNINITQRTILATCIGAGIVTIGLFAYAINQWHTDWTLAHLTIKATASHRDQSARLIASVPDAHLFGKAFAKTGDAPLSNLQFKVTGIVKIINSNEEYVSKAYISVDGKPAKIFEAGDSLPYGVKVYDIAPDAVLLENDGHLEKLLLPRETLKFKPRESTGGM